MSLLPPDFEQKIAYLRSEREKYVRLCAMFVLALRSKKPLKMTADGSFLFPRSDFEEVPKVVGVSADGVSLEERVEGEEGTNRSEYMLLAVRPLERPNGLLHVARSVPGGAT